MRLLFVGFLFVSFYASSQGYGEVWTKFGVEYRATKSAKYSVEMNSRFDNQGARTLFPKVEFQYKFAKWFKPSIEYRFIVARNKYSNYKVGHRINLNANFESEFDRFSFGTRARYQNSFQHYKASDDPSLEVAIRLRQSIEYDVKSSIFNPNASVEIFYNPLYGPEGRRFNNLRLNVGVGLDFKGPHNVSCRYQLDKTLHDYSKALRHVVAMSYVYKISR